VRFVSVAPARSSAPPRGRSRSAPGPPVQASSPGRSPIGSTLGVSRAQRLPQASRNDRRGIARRGQDFDLRGSAGGHGGVSAPRGRRWTGGEAWTGRSNSVRRCTIPARSVAGATAESGLEGSGRRRDPTRRVTGQLLGVSRAGLAAHGRSGSSRVAHEAGMQRCGPAHLPATTASEPARPRGKPVCYPAGIVPWGIAFR